MAIDRPVGLGFTPDPPPGFPKEQAAAIGGVKVRDDMTVANMFSEAQMAYKTGGAEMFGERGMTQLRSTGQKPSVTDLGVTVPSKPPEVGVRAEVQATKDAKTAREIVEQGAGPRS